MNTITQDMRYRLSLIKYAEKYGVTTRLLSNTKLTDSTYTAENAVMMGLLSLSETSPRRPHHPNQHTKEEIKLIMDMRRRNPDAGLVVFWVKLMKRGYSRSIPVFRYVSWSTGSDISRFVLLHRDIIAR